MDRELQQEAKLAGWSRYPLCSHWDKPGHDFFCCDQHPHFRTSLDSCFRWLVPKLLTMKWNIRLAWGGIPPGKPCVHLSNWGKKFNRQTRPQIAQLAETPAQALCNAIEVLIDWENEKEEENGVQSTS